MKFEEILTTYWSQTTLILLAFGYIIKNLVVHQQNKKQKNHELIQHIRIKSINDFYIAYFDCERMWLGLKIWQILNDQMTTDKVDDYVWPKYIEMQRAVFALQLALDENNMKLALDVESKNKELQKKLGKLFIMRNNEPILNRANEYEELRLETQLFCRNKISEMNKSIKLKYF